MKVFLDMVGCRLNQAEIEKLSLDLVREGHEVCTDPVDAELIVVNTCCVTAKAAADSRKMVRHYRRETSAQVLVTGCWTSVFGQEASALTLPELVVPNQLKGEIPDLIGRNFVAGRDVQRKPELGHRSRTRAFVKVQDGCNNRCSYCLTRVARGASTSVPQDEVIARVQDLCQMGVKEIVLTGVQLGSWGRDLERKQDLGILIKSILEETDIPRVRLSSIEPWDVNGELLECWQNPRVCRHLHIPLQSGSDGVLQSMRRPCSPVAFLRVLDAVQQTDPLISVTTDIIVGFPGETESDFDQTLALVRQAGFSGGHVFRFSPMPGTAAAELPGQVPSLVKDERAKVLALEFAQAKLAYGRSKIGQDVEVLWETGKPVGQTTRYSGLTSDELRASILSGAHLQNTLTRARVQSVDEQGGLLVTFDPLSKEQA